MKNLLFSCFLLCALPAAAQDFFDRHTGEYAGMLYLMTPGSTVDSLPFKIVIEPLAENRWTHRVIYYSNGDPLVKEYELAHDPDKGAAHYILDEKDGILITETLIDNTLYCNYTVDGMIYVVETTFSSDTIDYVLSCYKTAEKRESESAPDETERTWKVDSYGLYTVQKGTLHKVGK